MEISGVRHLISYPGAEKYEMLELNRRLESYLNHVKLLEEENQLLWEEIQALRRDQDAGGQRKAQEEALSLARKEVLIAWGEKDRVEVEVSNMLEEIEELNKLREKEKSAQVEAKRKLEESRKALEDERRMQVWLKKQAAHLENEISVQEQVHQDDLEALKSSHAFSKPVQMPPQPSQTLNLQGLGEKYSQRAAQAWREAAGVYQTQMKKLEESLGQSRAHMTLFNQEKKESQLQVHDLAKELKSTKAKREQLEKNLVQQRQRQNQDLHQLQAHVEALEVEKQDLGEQMGDLLVENRNLLQTKMSLNLEVATYRALLDNESLRVNNQSATKRNRMVSHLEGITKSPGISPGTQTSSSCLFSSPLNITPRSIAHKAKLMTSTSTKSLTLRAPQEARERPPTSRGEEDIGRVDTVATVPKNLNGEDVQDQYRAEEETSCVDSVSAAEIPKAEEPKSTLGQIVQEDLQEVLKAEVEQVLFSANETTPLMSPPAGHPHTPESLSPSQRIDEAKGSEDGDEEETEVSTEMAQISHAPMSAWEENETVTPEARDVVYEHELESGDIAEKCADEFEMDSDHAEPQPLGGNTNTTASLLLQEIPHMSADTFSPLEDDSEILTWADVKDDVLHFVEEESLKSAAELEKQSVNEEVGQVGEAEWPASEVLDAHESEINSEEEENESEHEEEEEEEEEVTQGREEEELTDGEEERVMEEGSDATFGEQKAELMMSTQENVDLAGENAVMATDGKDPEGERVKIVMNTPDEDLPDENNAEEEQRQSDEDESLNISASWRTDPGEADSYAQENTLADTRPLLHYTSDEETDANIPNARLGVSEHEGGSQLSHITAKRFDTMEDLSEEPELGSMDDIDTEGSVQTVLRESMDEEPVAEHEGDDTDSHARALTHDGVVGQSERDLGNNRNEDSPGEDETANKTSHLSTYLVENQEGSLASEANEINEPAAPFDLSGGAATENINNDETLNVESTEINPDGESNTSSPKPAQEQTPAEELHPEMPTVVTPSHGPLFKTRTDFTRELSVHRPDLDEPNSSDDESSNASQCSQLHSQSEDNVTTADVTSNPEPSFTDLVSAVLTKESAEACNAPQAEELGNKEEQQRAESFPEESRSVGSTADELGDVELENNKENRNIFQEDAPKEEEFQMTEKETDQHSFFSSSIKEGIWSATDYDTAATYDPNELKETEMHSYHSTDPNQTRSFVEDWGNLEQPPPANSKPAKDTQSTEEEEQEQKMPQTKPVECRDVKSGGEEKVHAGDSTDEGDSWSSGEE